MELVLLTFILIIFGVVATILGILFIIYSISTYNRFISLKNAAEATLSQIQVALKKRLDLLSKLVDSTKGYMNYEKSVLEKITKLRTSVFSNIKDITNVEKESKRILGNILVSVENYPDLKASQEVLELMNNIKEIEDEIARLRYTYNNIIQEYNTMTEKIPSNIIARIFNFKKLEYLEFETEDVKIEF